MAGGRNHTVKHHPLAAFAEIVFQFHNQGHVSSQINARQLTQQVLAAM
jgi:hypothetical protein